MVKISTLASLSRQGQARRQGLRRCGAALLGASAWGLCGGLSGCAQGGAAGALDGEGRVGEDGRRSGVGERLMPLMSFFGGWWQATLSSPRQWTPFGKPLGVMVIESGVLIADMAYDVIWHLQPQTLEMREWAALSGTVPAHPHAWTWVPGEEIWTLSQAPEKVCVLDTQGQRLKEWGLQHRNVRPVSLAPGFDRDECLVADAGGRQILVFDRSGKYLRELTALGSFQDVSRIRMARMGLYVLDREEPGVRVVGMDGQLLDIIGSDDLVKPRDFAVRDDGWMVVADAAGPSLVLFHQGRLVQRWNSEGRFQDLAAVEIHGQQIMAVDSGTGRIDVFRSLPTMGSSGLAQPSLSGTQGGPT